MQEQNHLKLVSSKTFHEFHGAFINDKYTDFTVTYHSQHLKTSIRAHRIILANHSDFFRTAFDNPSFRESTNARIDLNFEDPRGALPLIFEYMYRGEIHASPMNIIPIIHFADILLCTELLKLANDALKDLISAFSIGRDDVNSSECLKYRVDTILNVLKDAVFFEKSGIIDDIIDALAPRFDEISPSHDLSFLDFPLFNSLVSHHSCILESEFKLYSIISKYVSKKVELMNA